MRLSVEFVGGYRDGQTFDAASDDSDEAKRAAIFLQMTDGGVVGGELIEDPTTDMIALQRDNLFPSDSGPYFLYTVTDRARSTNGLTVRLEHRGNFRCRYAEQAIGRSRLGVCDQDDREPAADDDSDDGQSSEQSVIPYPSANL